MCTHVYVCVYMHVCLCVYFATIMVFSLLVIMAKKDAFENCLGDLCARVEENCRFTLG